MNHQPLPTTPAELARAAVEAVSKRPDADTPTALRRLADALLVRHLRFDQHAVTTATENEIARRWGVGSTVMANGLYIADDGDALPDRGTVWGVCPANVSEVRGIRRPALAGPGAAGVA
jgi:hypothetical protein